jgi:hypothetical protein
MNEKEIKLQKEVMIRIHAIHHLRTVTRPFFVELGLFIVSLVSIGFMVSVPHVITNTLRSGNALSYLPYIARSFLHTSVLVQGVLAFGLVMFVLLAREMAKNFSHQSLAFRKFQ